MSRRFYLPPRQNVSPPKAKLPQGRLLQITLSAAALALVVVSIWWYFSDQTRWESESSQRSYLGSSTKDSSHQAVGTPDADSPDLSTSGAPNPAGKLGATSSALPVVDHPVRLELRNGCYKKGLAQQVASALRARSMFFDVRGMVNSRGDTVEFSSVVGRTADSSLALAVADSLGISRTRVSVDIPRFPRDVDVTVVLGKDYPRLRLNLKPDAKE